MILNRRTKNMMGKKCGRLLVKKFAYIKNYPKNKNKVAHWDCVCDCGNRKIVDGRSLRNGSTKSCGCLMREIASETHKNKPKSKEQRLKMSIVAIGRKHSEEHRRKNSESKMGLYNGEKNPNWRGGTAGEPYSFNFVSELRNKIRKRDNYRCQICGIKESNLTSYHQKLPIHHIDYNKTNDNPKNLITLCNSCHSKTNFNRENWQKYFEISMEAQNYISMSC